MITELNDKLKIFEKDVYQQLELIKKGGHQLSITPKKKDIIPMMHSRSYSKLNSNGEIERKESITSYNRLIDDEDNVSINTISNIKIDWDGDTKVQEKVQNVHIDFDKIINSSSVECFSNTYIRFEGYMLTKFQEKLIIGFGINNNKYSNSIYTLDMNGGDDFKQINYNYVAPSGRAGVGFAIVKNWLYLYGGYSKENNQIKIFDDFFKINLEFEDNYCECQLIAEHLYIGNRYLMKMVALNYDLYIFGGYDYYSQVYPNDIVVVQKVNKLSNLEDRKIPTTIPGRANHIMSEVNSLDLLICLGNDHQKLLSDFYLFNVSTEENTILSFTGVKPDKGLSTVHHENNLIIYGGKFGMFMVINKKEISKFKLVYEKNYVHKNGGILVDKSYLYDVKNSSKTYTRKLEFI